MQKIGIFSIKEQFSQDLIQKINSLKKDDVRAEFAVVGESRFCEPNSYRVMIDRISAYVSYFKVFFRNAALAGSYVINNPFGLLNVDRFSTYAQGKSLGFEIPRTVCLPTREYHPDSDEQDLANLKYPLNWEEIGDFIGFPAILKPYSGYGFRDIFNVNNMAELIECYNGTGRQITIMQESIEYDAYIRTFVVGEETWTVRYTPATKEFSSAKKALKGFPVEKIKEGSRRLSKDLGIDFNTVDFGMKGDVPYLVNFLNPHPDFREETISEDCYKWCVDNLANLAVQYALSDKTNVCYTELKCDSTCCCGKH